MQDDPSAAGELACAARLFSSFEQARIDIALAEQVMQACLRLTMGSGCGALARPGTGARRSG
ncbi:MAG TPA: hypothetical protein DIW77_23535 [Chromatiaceae bacterium]|nr:MAG: hypothetical protein N838_11755 [Thiohalocapsa sp. PB-PSB1]HCS92925.1 hypothetical protein [Chromatiaceae bacterium]